MTMARVYVASPYGFTEAGRRFLPAFHAAIEAAGANIYILDPWAAPPMTDLVSTGLRNFASIRQADLVVAGLDGPDVDSGTAAEIGYATGLQIPVIGYRNDMRASQDHPDGQINLQVETCLHLRGAFVTQLDELTRAVAKILHATRQSHDLSADHISHL